MLKRLVTRPAPRGMATLLRAVPVQPYQSLRLISTVTPTIMSGSFWRSLVPKPLRKENRQNVKKAPTKEWNPATFYIVIFLLIGSMSIQMIALRNSMQRYLRQADVRIGLLREVVERIQKGEDVDVERMLGTGDPEREAEWEEVLRAIEQDEPSKKPSKKTKQRQPETESETTKMAALAAEEPAAVVTQPPPTNKSGSSFGNFF